MRIAVLVSGSGTNLQALLDAQQRGDLHPANIVLVLSNRPGVAALQRAEAAGVPSEVLDHTTYETRQRFEEALVGQLEAHQIEAIVLAGFMRILSPYFVDRYPQRILNTHPALCPSFPGVRAPRQAIEAGVKVSGCTVHFVDTGVDTGPIIFQEAVPVHPGDTPESLHRRIQSIEHRLLPEATRALARGQLEIVEGCVRMRG
jgi:formyltetrahydrofolate-dependent phosphoribosylglycinamide formyltransferase